MTEFYSRNHTSMKKKSSKYWQRDDPGKELESKVTKKKFFFKAREHSLQSRKHNVIFKLKLFIIQRKLSMQLLFTKSLSSNKIGWI